MKVPQRLTLKGGKVQLAIIKGEEFTAGNMGGALDKYPLWGRLEGEALRTLVSRRFRPSPVRYVVYSYWTPIAWFADDTWYVVEDKFSVTTTRHQNIVREALAMVPRFIALEGNTRRTVSQ